MKHPVKNAQPDYPCRKERKTLGSFSPPTGSRSAYIFAFRENNVKIKHWVSPGRDSVGWPSSASPEARPPLFSRFAKISRYEGVERAGSIRIRPPLDNLARRVPPPGGIDAAKSPVRSAGPSPNRGLACVAVQRSRQTQPLTLPSPAPGRGRNTSPYFYAVFSKKMGTRLGDGANRPSAG